MKKMGFIVLFLFSLNTYSDTNLRTKYAGVWSQDCANLNLPRVFRTVNLNGEDESIVKRSNGEILYKSKYKIQSITEKKFRVDMANSNMKDGKVFSKNNSENIFEFAEGYKGINFNQIRLINSLLITNDGEKIQYAKDGFFVTKQSDGSLKQNGETPMSERCLN